MRAALGLCCVLCVACGDATSDVSLETADLQVLGEAGEVRLEVMAELATTAAQRATGLGGHERLASDEGMLLVFPGETRACVTNGPVRFAIDVVYLSSDRRVVAVERMLAPGDPQVYCHGSTELVLEVAGSIASDVQVGDLLTGH